MNKPSDVIRIERRPTAHGTTLDDPENTPVVIITFPNGKKGVYGEWTTFSLPYGRVQATKATDDQIRAAFRGKTDPWLGIAKVTE